MTVVKEQNLRNEVINIKQDSIHYNIDTLASKNALFNLLLGEKSGGKSYQVKHKMAVEHFLETGQRFILLRRWKDEVKSDKIEQYFSDVDIEKLTDGKFNCTTFWRGGIYLSHFDSETFTTTKGVKMGYAIALSQEQNYSSVSFLDVDNIIFEEFMSRTAYIANEANKLMIFYDTVDRKRGKVRLWLVGNTISRVCPYLHDWKLSTTIRDMKQGDIRTIDIKTENNSIKLAIEYCRESKQKSYAIGSAATMISGGNWMSEPQPHLQDSIKKYKVVLRIVFCYADFKFLATLYTNAKGVLVWFICPKYTAVKKNTIVIGLVGESVYYNKNIYNLDYRIKNNIRELIYKTFVESNIFYSNDLCGTDFKQCIDFAIKK